MDSLRNGTHCAPHTLGGGERSWSCPEALASVTIINLLKPGYPAVLGNWAFVSDLRTGAFSSGGGEQALLGAASGQIIWTRSGARGRRGDGVRPGCRHRRRHRRCRVIPLALARSREGGALTEHVRVAVIGGGIVGCSVLCRLAVRGWADTLLLERRELTSGSTRHAAGNVTYFGHNPGLTRLYVDSIRTCLDGDVSR